MIYEQPELKIDKEAQKKPKNFIKLPQKHFPQGHVTQTNMLTRLRKTLQVTLNVETYETCHK